APPVRRPPLIPRRVARLTAAAALVASIAAAFQFSAPKTVRDAASDSPDKTQHAGTPGDDGPIARGRPDAPPATRGLPGTLLATGAGERRRVVLPDGSTLYLNQNTVVRCEADRKITLKRGEVYVEVSPRPASSTDAKFLVQTPRRSVTALGTKFLVKAD